MAQELELEVSVVEIFIKNRNRAVLLNTEKSFRENNRYWEVGKISFPKWKMNSNLMPAEATHTTLDLLEKQPLLITFDNVFTQKVGPSYSPDGPMLEFEVVGDRNNFIDLQKFLPEKNAKSREPMTPIWELVLMQQTQIHRILAITHCTLCFQSVQSRQMVLNCQTATMHTRLS